MKNIETAIAAIETEKLSQIEKMNIYDDVIAKLKNLQRGDLNTSTPSENKLVLENNNQANQDKKEFFKEYPYEKKLADKLIFLDKVLNRPFRATSRLDIIGALENDKRREEYSTRISSQLRYMVDNYTYIGQKYGSNLRTFYFKKEWATWDGKEYKIKPEYEITPEEFELAGVPESKRKNFDWVLPKGMKLQQKMQNTNEPSQS